MPLSFPRPAAAQDDEIDFTAEVDQIIVSTSDMITLQLSLKGAYRNYGHPDLSTLEGFNILSSGQSNSIAFVNGNLTSEVIYTYILQPVRTGLLTIPSISITINGVNYSTEPIQIEVLEGGEPVPQGTPGGSSLDQTIPGGIAGQDVFIQAEVDNLTPLMGQQVIYRFRSYQLIQLYARPELKWPEFKGFLVYDLSPNTQYYQRIDNFEYQVTEVRRAIFPTSPGALVIDPAQLSVPSSVLSNAMQLETEPITLEVQPLPEDAPAGYSGAIGQFNIAASLSPDSGVVGSPVTLVVKVTGIGNINLMSDVTESLAEQLPDWRIYEARISTNLQQDGDTIQGSKRIERLLVPNQAGAYTIPAFQLWYFDPELEDFIHIQTSPIPIEIKPGDPSLQTEDSVSQQDVLRLGSDIRHIKPAPPTLQPHHTELVQQTGFWLLWGLPLLWLLLIWGLRQQSDRRAANIPLVRARKALASASRRLKQAQKITRNMEREPESFSLVASAINHFIGDHFNLSAAGLTHDAITSLLQRAEIHPASIDQLLSCLHQADSGRFAPQTGRGAVDLVQFTRSTLKEIDKKLRQNDRSSSRRSTL